MNMMLAIAPKPKFSETSKMPKGCLSWSLEALKTCAGAIDITGEIVDPCKICYARDGFYKMPVVKEARAYNKKDWKRPEWEDDMVERIIRILLFRWYDSGDCYTVKLAWKMYNVMKRTPNCQHWFPTRNYKFNRYKEVLDAMAALPNVVVRFSSDSISGGIVDGNTTSTIIPYIDTPTTATVCYAYDRGGKCGDCRACWDKDVEVVAYPAHGRMADKLIKMREVA
jgi:hypothetical protein